MYAVFSVRKAIVICTAVLLGFTFTAWKEGETKVAKTTQDTVPPQREKKIRDLDDALNELEGAHDDLEKSINDVDWKKIDADLKDALKDLDVNMKHMNDDLKKSLSEIDVEKMRADAEASIAKIDWDEIKQSIAKAKDINTDQLKAELEKVKDQLEKQKPELEKQLRNAHEGIEKAKAELREYKGFVDGLERDGLINKREGYTIEHRDGQLTINGKQQPASVYDRYRTFLEKNKKFTLKKNLDDFTMEND